VVSSQNLGTYGNESALALEGGAPELMSREQPNAPAAVHDQEWQGAKQLHPAVAFAFLALGMVILAAITFYTKLMIQFENQNAMEAFYAINGFTLILFTIIILMKIRT